MSFLERVERVEGLCRDCGQLERRRADGFTCLECETAGAWPEGPAAYFLAWCAAWAAGTIDSRGEPTLGGRS